MPLHHVVLWVFAVFLVFGSFVVVSSVGKPRQPLTGAVAGLTVAIQVLAVWALIETLT